MYVRKIEFETVIDSSKDRKIEDDDWLVYGHNDLLRTSSLGEGSELDEIYKNNIELSGDLQQVFYLLHDKDDKDFINKAQSNNFLSIFFITLSYNRIETGFDLIKKYLINSKNEFNDISVYETLDNYDLIVLCRGDSIQDIECRFKDYLDKCLENKNIYIRDIYKMYTTHYTKINGDTINDNEENIKIQFSLKNSFNPDELKKQLPCVNYTMNNINGSKDIYINMTNIKTSDLFSLYKTNNESPGVFSLKSDFRRKYITSTNLKFLTKIDDDFYKYYNWGKNDDVSDLFKEYIKNINFSDIEIRSLYKLDLKRVLNAMSNVLELSLSDYSFLSLYLGIKKFLQKLNEIKKDPKLDYYTRLFLESCFSIINTSSATQIGYYPKQEYVSKEIIAPSELMSFYSSFLWIMTSTIISIEKLAGATSNPEFTFCLTPSIRENVVVKGLFMEDNKINDRLLLVDIPIENVYKPDIMLFSLCHEASHYTGELVRLREERLNYIYKTYAIYLLDSILYGVDSELLKKYPISSDIEKMFHSNVNDIVRRTKLPYYSESVNNILKEATQNILLELLYSLRDMFHYYITKDNIAEESREVISIFNRIKNNIINMTFNNSYVEKIECILEMFSESYADLFAILFLGIDKEKYDDFITVACREESLSNIESDYVLIRVLANYYANGFDESNLSGKIAKQKKVYEEYKSSSKNTPIKFLSTVFENAGMLANLISYLEECRRSYNKIYGNKWNRKVRKLMKKKSDIDDLLKKKLNINIIYEYNKAFRKHIIEDIKKTACK